MMTSFSPTRDIMTAITLVGEWVRRRIIIIIIILTSSSPIEFVVVWTANGSPENKCIPIDKQAEVGKKSPKAAPMIHLISRNHFSLGRDLLPTSKNNMSRSRAKLHAKTIRFRRQYWQPMQHNPELSSPEEFRIQDRNLAKFDRPGDSTQWRYSWLTWSTTFTLFPQHRLPHYFWWHGF